MRQLELRHDGDVIGIVYEGGWLTLPNGDALSPALEGWSNEDGYSLVVHVPPDPEPEPVDLIAYAADARWRRETGGVQFGGFTVATDDRSKLMIVGARAAAQADPDFTTEWKLPDAGFVTLDAAAIIAISDAVLAHVAESFSREAAVIAAIEDETISTPAQIDAAFDAVEWPALV